MSSSDENQDLQTYFDTFKGEESNDCVTLTAEALRALSEADAVTEKILEEDAGSNTDDDCLVVKSSENLKSNDGKKGIYYLKLSNQKSIQVKLIDEADFATSAQDSNTQYAEEDTERIHSPYREENKSDREKIYEFDEDEDEDEDDSESKTADDDCETQTEKFVIRRSVMHVVPRTNQDTVETQAHKCPKCPYSTNKRFLLSRHLHIHSDERPYKCSVCDRSFRINPSLVNHMNSHLGKKPHGCTFCEMRFNTSGELVRHVRYRHTGEKPHKCGECDYASVELSKMRRHMRCHTGERPFQCPHCTYASPDTFKLKRHLRTHTGEKPYECDICLARFTQSNSLKSHRLIHTAGDRPTFQCSLCPTTCGRKTDLQLHVQKLHNPDHPVKCKRCGKELPDRYSYKVHIKTHEGEKCFRCKICPYASISQRHLGMHMLVHTDEKPFICEHCGSSFRQRQLLLRHINLYHNDEYVPPTPSEKSHVCPHCNRAFTRKGNLMRHMETHDSRVDKQIEQLKLKIGRQIRIQSDGSLSLPSGGIDCVLGKQKNTDDENNDDDDEAEDDEGFSLLEIEDEETIGNDGSNTKVIAIQPLIEKSGTKTRQNTTIKTGPKKFIDRNKLVVLPSKTKQRTSIKREKVKPVKPVKPEQTTVTVDIGDENEHFMIIEVIDEDAGGEDGMAIGDSTIHSSILELPVESDEKRNTVNSIDFSNVKEYVLPMDYKSSHITIVNAMNDD